VSGYTKETEVVANNEKNIKPNFFTLCMVDAMLERLIYLNFKTSENRTFQFSSIIIF